MRSILVVLSLSIFLAGCTILPVVKDLETKQKVADLEKAVAGHSQILILLFEYLNLDKKSSDPNILL